MSIHVFTVARPDGSPISLEQYKGNPVLIVNTASACGYTPQFGELQSLYETYKDQGFEVLGFPCNQFGGQEPGTAVEAEQFCSLNYGVTFRIFDKINVKGPQAAPLFTYLTGRTGEPIQWNFTKFLVDADGHVVRQYGSGVKPSEIAADLEPLLR